MIEEETKFYAGCSLAFGLIGLILFLVPYVGIVLGVIAIVCYSIDKSNSGLAKAGLVTGMIAIVLNAICGLFAWFILTIFG